MEVDIICGICGKEMTQKLEDVNLYRIIFSAMCKNCKEENKKTIQELERRLREMGEELAFAEI